MQLNKNYSIIILLKTILSSSAVEQSAVNRLVVGSSPTWGELRYNLNIHTHEKEN